MASQIYLSYRMVDLSTNGLISGITQKQLRDSILWKLRGVKCSEDWEKEGAEYNIFPIGLYQDSDLRTIIVKAVYKGAVCTNAVATASNNVIEFTEQIGGFIRPEVTDGIIPLHITTWMKPGERLNPMEGGIRAQLYGYQPWTGDPGALSNAVVEYCILCNLYEYIEPACN